MLRILLFLGIALGLSFCGVSNSYAFHIVGGEMTYECLGGDVYEINLIVYRDCNSSGAPFDTPAHLFVFRTIGGTQVSKRDILFPGSQIINPPTDICVETLPNICVERAIYSTTLTLPPVAGGYTLVYQRYSRNSTLVNIVAPDMTGSTYSTEIPTPALAACNNSPTFDNFPPTVICANSPLVFDHSATDIDGDSLVYDLCVPLIGGSDFCPQPGSFMNCDPPGLPATPPPHSTVTYANPYSAANPMGGSPPLSIDPHTGLLTGTPLTVGQFVVGICVTEFRNGIAINTVRRDFQFNVTDCKVVNAAVESDHITAEGEYVITDCKDDLVVDFVNISLGGDEYEWDFGDPNTLLDVSFLENPSYEYPDSGVYYAIMIAKDDLFASCADTAHVIVNLYPTLIADFDYVVDCVYFPVEFTDLSTTTYGTINAWEWRFGDGNSSLSQHPSHTYAQGGNYIVTLETRNDLGCVAEFQQEIYVFPVPENDFSTTLKCPGLPIEFFDETTGADVISWQWNFGDPGSGADNFSVLEDPTHVYFDDGDYTVQLITESVDGCYDTLLRSFTIFPEFIADAGVDEEICIGQSIELQASEEFPWFIYEWAPAGSLDNPTLSRPIATPAETTTYNVEISDPNGCVDHASVTITVHPLPEVSLDDDLEICLGESVVLMATVGANVVDFLWSGPDLNDAVNLNPMVSPDTTATYTLWVLDDEGCENADSLTITVVLPVVASVGGENTFCEGESTQLIADGGDFYSWTPSVGLSDPTIANPIASPNETTVYTVTVSNVCFEDTASVVVSINPLPFVDAGTNQTINVGETALINAVAEQDFSWSPVSGLSDSTSLRPVAMPLETITYLLTTTDEHGCVNRDSVQIVVTNVFEFLIPNAFSPNDDGVNDVFRVISSLGIRDLLAFRIYDRWGNKIFETGDINEGWDGFYNRRPAALGVYVYYIQAITFLDEEFVHKGNVTLIR